MRRHIGEKLGCEHGDAELMRAPLGDKFVEGGRFGSTLVAPLVVDKYTDGLPLHRQKQRFARVGFEVAVSTPADQVTWATDLLRPLWRGAIAVVIAARVMHLDGTGLAVLDPGVQGGKKARDTLGLHGRPDGSVSVYLDGQEAGATTGRARP